MKTLMIFCAVLLIASCSNDPAPVSTGAANGSTARLPNAGGSMVTRVTDPEFGVVCYVSDGYKAGGISCLRLDAADRTP